MSVWCVGWSVRVLCHLQVCDYAVSSIGRSGGHSRACVVLHEPEAPVALRQEYDEASSWRQGVPGPGRFGDDLTGGAFRVHSPLGRIFHSEICF